MQHFATCSVGKCRQGVVRADSRNHIAALARSAVTVAWVGQEPLKADAADRQKGVAIEFISQQECEDLDRA